MTSILMAAGGPGAMFISQVLAFVILMVVVIKLAAPAVGKIAGARSKSIQDEFDRLEKGVSEAKARLADLQKRSAGLEQEAKDRYDRAMAEAGKTRDQVLADAEAQARAAADRARREAETERDKTVLELRESVARLALEAAGHVVRSAMDDRLQERLVDKATSKLDAVIRT